MNVSFNQSKNRATLQSGRIMTSEQMTQVIEAIVDGKYSWACVLMLHSIGYNPIDYIPYRTYARIIKDNRLSDRRVNSNLSLANRINDLSCLEPLEKEGDRTQINSVRGGSRAQSYLPSWLTRWM
ncbi:MAG: HetP family heterocyst commitment protein [Timaviella obliquedivisa GSE-PSE-MK23-08B]|jgi:hypothetical protein|nr:HetP family heterocyst commitment protein [Timaviella obliquedivisa GSE-PSE-MK23-08B]